VYVLLVVFDYQSDNTKHNNNEVATTSTTSTDSTKLVTSAESNNKINSNHVNLSTFIMSWLCFSSYMI
jgi:bifunctional autolysin